MILVGDCLVLMRAMDADSIDAIVTDPPYHLTSERPGCRSPATEGKVMRGFMGMAWDGGDVAMRPETWAEALRVAKPGAYLAAFGGTRTYHRMACAIEDAGWELRDTLMWVYGSGFPKSKNLDGDRKGWGTALKPAWEPIILARKPLAGTVAANVQAHGTGALNIDGCRIGTDAPLTGGATGKRTALLNMGGQNTRPNHCRAGEASAERRYTDEGGTNFAATPGPRGGDPAGRWPANLIHDGSEDVLAVFPQAVGQQGRARTDGEPQGNAVLGALRHVTTQPEPRGDTGSAARFFKQCEADPCESLSPAPIAALPSSLQSLAGGFVQSGAATWPSLAGTLSSDALAASIPVTPSESRAIAETVIAAMATIGSECSHESQHERRTPCGSLARTVATRAPTGTTTITTSLCKSDGSAGRATFTITPTSLDRGEAVSRFNYCAKASKADRDEGLESVDAKACGLRDAGRFNSGGRTLVDGEWIETGSDPQPKRNVHPTVKPTDLMRYLCRLVTPPGGLILDPFTGSGSTGRGAILEGFRFVGCELSAEYAAIAEARIAAVMPKPEPARESGPQLSLALEVA